MLLIVGGRNRENKGKRLHFTQFIRRQTIDQKDLSFNGVL